MEDGIFEGLKVLDCASFIAAPAAATVLSDFGAQVIKIEPPGSGDPYRNLPNLPGYPHSEHNFAWLLEARNKRSLALDLSKPEGQAVLHRLAAEADVFITNFPPAVRGRLGIAYAELAPLNERLIYASFTGYGEKGEEANKPGFDSNAYWARSGLMDLVRADTTTTPARSVAGMGDHPCAMALYGAIVTALYKRERTGKGSHVASNLMANGVWANGVMAQAKLCGAKFSERRPREHALNAVTNHYKCRDGRWIILSLLNEEKQWPALARCLGREDLISDARFASKTDRHARSLELIGLLTVSMLSPSNGTSTSLSIICRSVGISSRMPTTPNTRPLPSSRVRHSARSRVAKISSNSLISSSERAWRSGLVANLGSVMKSSRPRQRASAGHCRSSLSSERMSQRPSRH